MFHMNWNSRRESRGGAASPFHEMELQMRTFRDFARSSFGERGFQQELPFLGRMSDLPVLPGARMDRFFPGSLIDDVMGAVISDSLTISNHSGVERQRGPRRRRQLNNQELSRDVTRDVTHPREARVTARDVIYPGYRETRHLLHPNREEENFNFANRNTYPFPVPREDRTTWYDPNEPVPQDRLPQIPSRFLTLAQIGRIPTRKISETVPNKSCDICLEDFKKGDTTKILNCKHDYHVTCVDPWLKQHTTCPKCRRQVRAPPENARRPPRPPPPPCPMRERVREYDRERRARLNQQQQLNGQQITEETTARLVDIQNVAELPSVAAEDLTTATAVRPNVAENVPTVRPTAAAAVTAAARPVAENTATTTATRPTAVTAAARPTSEFPLIPMSCAAPVDAPTVHQQPAPLDAPTVHQQPAPDTAR